MPIARHDHPWHSGDQPQDERESCGLSQGCKMYRRFAIVATAVLLSSTAARAGETILYSPVESWVEIKSLPKNSQGAATPSSTILLDRQVRLQDGTVWTYSDGAMQLSTPELVTNATTLTAVWQPEQGDLVIHRVELIRENTVIDVLAAGAKFEVLRREQQLENRTIDGFLTATMTVPGARVGDILRLAYTVSAKDKALDGNMEWSTALPAKPFDLAVGEVAISWPEKTKVHIQLLKAGVQPRQVAKDGYLHVAVPLPVAKQDEMPTDAPLRFQAGPQIAATTFNDWKTISATMASLFLERTVIPSGSPLSNEVAKIEASSTDPVQRAALATQLVQDHIAYLANGLNGGNYVPQTAVETWDRRFGDCKAKTVLLLALLSALKIDGEPVLVKGWGGDILPELMPMAQAFDHVLVRATINGTSYWLDGTSSGTRHDNLALVPQFSFGLPLSRSGSDLIPVAQRLPESPMVTLNLALDSSAGLSIPTPYHLKGTFNGALAASFNTLARSGNRDQIEEVAANFSESILGDNQSYDYTITSDQDTGAVTIGVSGLLTTPWKRSNERYELNLPVNHLAKIAINADRAPAAWRNIPLALPGPMFERSTTTVDLPGHGAGFTISGDASINETIAGMEVVSQAQIDNGSIVLAQSMRRGADELPAAELPPVRRQTAELQRRLPKFQAPPQIRTLWQYTGQDAALLKKVRGVYARLIADAEPDEKAGAYANRAAFLRGVGDYAEAEKDFTRAIESEASAYYYSERGRVRANLGRIEDALSDYLQAESQNGDGNTASARIELAALLGRPQDGLIAADEFASVAESETSAKQVMASALGFAGRGEEGVAILERESTTRPGDPDLLNALCWNAALWNLSSEATLKTCDTAVAKSNWSPAVLDSRALNYYRLGRLEEAHADLDAVLAASPSAYQSRYLRGVVRLRQGDQGGQEDISIVRQMAPYVLALNQFYKIAPPR